jgi:tetratricopeptide (TPR) repeat protein
MDRNNRNSPVPPAESKNERSKDYLAVCVFVGLVIALIVAGHFALKNLGAESGFRLGPYVRKWTRDIEEKVQGLLGEATKDLKTPGSERTDARTHLLKGYRLHRQKSYNAAVEELNKAIQADPGNAEAYYWRGRTLVNLGSLDQGVEDFKKAVSLKPDYSEAYDHLGWLATKEGEVDEGIAYLTKSIEFKPDNGWAFFSRSKLFFSKGDVASAMKDAEKACSLGYQDGCNAYEIYKHSSGEKD